MNKYYEEGFNFFTLKDFQQFATIASTPYKKGNEENIRASKVVSPLLKKVNVWAAHSQMEGYYAKPNFRWKSARSFSGYFWTQIYREGFDKRIFFKIGAVKNGLFFGIDCLRKTQSKKGQKKAVPLEKQVIFDRYIKEEGIKTDHFFYEGDLQDYNWEKLIKATRRIIADSEENFANLEKIITGELNIDFEKEKGSLTPILPPSKTRTKIPNRRTYKGYPSTNYAKKQTEATKLGTCGEYLVLRYEKQKLSNAGLLDLIEKVKKMPDGVGYDIRSFDESGTEIHIEVKTTVCTIDEPFYMSENEKDYFRDYPDNYFLYRLCNYRKKTGSADFYTLKIEDLKNAIFSPTNYEVSLSPNSKIQDNE